MCFFCSQGGSRISFGSYGHESFSDATGASYREDGDSFFTGAGDVLPVESGLSLRASGPVSAGPVSPTLDQQVSYLTGLNPDGTLTNNSFWGSRGQTAHKWGAPTAGTGAVITYTFANSNLTLTEQETFEKAFAMWSAFADVVFVEGDANANVSLVRGSDGGAWQDGPVTNGSGSTLGGYTGQATISIDTSVTGFDLSGSLDVVGGYGMSTVIHEVGHLLGLGHGGPYNGAVDPLTEQFSAYDERQWTAMSYIDWHYAETLYKDTYPVPGTNWGEDDGFYRQAPHTAMALDILAIQQLYGASEDTPLSGGQVFGFNSNIAGPLRQFFDFRINTQPVVTLYSAGTGNTLDLSGFSQSSNVNLTPGKFSSAAGQINNIAIAFATVIEKAITGSGNDSLYGSSGKNALIGGAGVDSLSGAGGSDALYGGVGNDKLYGGTESDLLSGQTGSDILYGGTGNDKLYGGTEHDTLLGEAGADTLYGDAGDDRLYGGTENDLLSGGIGNDQLKGDAGNDKLYGGAGKDVLYGGTGKDVFVFDTALNRTTNLDRILDYSVADDTLWLDNKYLPKLGSGSAAKPVKLNAAYFAYDVAKDANDHLIYNRKSGVLSYDADGSGAGRAVEIAILKPGLGITYNDVYII